MKIFLFNGPPRSGKNKAAEIMAILLQQYGHSLEIKSFAEPVKRAVHYLYGLDVPPDYFEEVKDSPRPEFFFSTPREAYIKISQHGIKPILGESFFAQLLARSINKQKYTLITDGGFQNELENLIHNFGKEAVVLIKLYRKGTSFDFDSRTYLSHDNSFYIRNDEEIVDMIPSCKHILDKLSIFPAGPEILHV